MDQTSCRIVSGREENEGGCHKTTACQSSRTHQSKPTRVGLQPAPRSFLIFPRFEASVQRQTADWVCAGVVLEYLMCSEVVIDELEAGIGIDHFINQIE